MKKLLLTLLALMIGLGKSFAQEFKVDYKIQYKYTHHSNLSSIENSQSESLYLFTGENQSVFVNHNVAHEEEINKKRNVMLNVGNYDSSAWGEKQSYFHQQYYKNHDAQEVWVLNAYSNEYPYAYAELRVPLEWTILEQTKEFMGFNVQSATADFAGRSYTAWFTSDIPIPDGPHVFYGLPGLVVDVYDSEKHFRFQLEGIEKVETETVQKLPKYKKVTRSEYSKISANHKKMDLQFTLKLIREDAIQYADDSEPNKKITEAEYLSHIRKQEEEQKKNHNPMELE